MARAVGDDGGCVRAFPNEPDDGVAECEGRDAGVPARASGALRDERGATVAGGEQPGAVCGEWKEEDGETNRDGADFEGSVQSAK